MRLQLVPDVHTSLHMRTKVVQMRGAVKLIPKYILRKRERNRRRGWWRRWQKRGGNVIWLQTMMEQSEWRGGVLGSMSARSMNLYITFLSAVSSNHTTYFRFTRDSLGPVNNSGPFMWHSSDATQPFGDWIRCEWVSQRERLQYVASLVTNFPEILDYRIMQ